MKKTLFTLILIASVFSIAYFTFNKEEFAIVENSMESKRQKHEKFLAESPYKETKNLSKSERKKLALPPNAYNERLWELTMNPELGYPTPYLVEPIDMSTLAKAAPGSANIPWVERGPLQVGGRTRVTFFDPNDVGSNNGDGVDYNRVFAGSVGGGLWVNDNIEDENSSWTIVAGLAANLTVSAYAIDPNNTNIMYLGTGEQYTDGAAVGTGLYKSIDGGTTWVAVNIPVAGAGDITTGSGIFQRGIFFINDIVIRNVNGTSEIYVAVGAASYSSPNFNISNPNNFLGAQSSGLYRSTDQGNNWSRIEDSDFRFSFNGEDIYVTPNDFEISANNQLVMGTIGTTGINQGGGRIYSSSDGTNWTQLQEITGGDRVEIAASATNPDLFFVLAQVSGRADIFQTTDGFTTLTKIAEPDDADQGIPTEDFTRNQSFYDLVIEVDPENDRRLYVGGINVHSSRNSGGSWSQISKWSNNRDMNNLNVPFVHADIHAITFHPTNPNKGLIGSDGGVSLVDSFTGAARSSTAISNRNLGYNVTQFYYGDINQIDFQNGDDFIGGTQDNGSPVIDNSVLGTGLTASFDPTGGDGSYSAIDGEDGYAILGYTSRTHIYLEYPITNSSSSYFISNEDDGDFINVAELDPVYDIFYANSRPSSGGNSITACAVGPNSADCEELTFGGLLPGRPTAMKASPYSTVTSTLFVGTENSRVLQVGNAGSNTGKTVIDISDPNFLGSVSDIGFGATQLDIYVTFHNYGVNNIWFTSDGGVTWAQKDGNLPDIPVKAILQNPLIANEVIIGTETGIYTTTDFDSDSPTWTQTNNGMTNVKVVDLDLRTADNTILATTHGRGMFTGKFTADTASIGDVLVENTVMVYPTNAKNEIFISSDNNYTNSTIHIYNLNGQEVFSKTGTISNSAQRLDIASLSSGLYLIKIKGDGVNQTSKFLKE